MRSGIEIESFSPEIEQYDFEIEKYDTEMDKFKTELVELMLRFLKSDPIKDRVRITDGEDENATILQCKIGETRPCYIFDSEAVTKLDISIHRNINQLINNIDISAMSQRDQTYIYNLCEGITTSNNCYELWDITNSNLRKMPGWWRFFDKLRPFAMDISELLIDFKDFNLKNADIVYLNGLIKNLITQIEKLILKLNEVYQLCDGLRRENDQLNRKLKENGDSQKIKHLESDVRKLRKKFAGSISTFSILQKENEMLIVKHNEDLKETQKNYLALKHELELMEDQKNSLNEQVIALLEQLEEVNQNLDRALVEIKNKNKTEHDDKLSKNEESMSDDDHDSDNLIKHKKEKKFNLKLEGSDGSDTE